MQGFGVTARSTIDTRKLDPTAIIVFHQSDVGEYLRDEVSALRPQIIKKTNKSYRKRYSNAYALISVFPL